MGIKVGAAVLPDNAAGVMIDGENVAGISIGGVQVWPATPKAPGRPGLSRTLDTSNDPNVSVTVTITFTDRRTDIQYFASWVSGDDGDWTTQIPTGWNDVSSGGTFTMVHSGALDDTINPIIQITLRSAATSEVASDPQSINLRTGASPA